MAQEVGLNAKAAARWKTLQNNVCAFGEATKCDTVVMSLLPKRAGGQHLVTKGPASILRMVLSNLYPQIVDEYKRLASSGVQIVPDEAETRGPLPSLPAPVDQLNVGERRFCLRRMIEYSCRRAQPLWGKPETMPEWWDTSILPWANIDKDRRAQGQKTGSHSAAIGEVIKAGYRFYGIMNPVTLERVVSRDSESNGTFTSQNTDHGVSSAQQPDAPSYSSSDRIPSDDLEEIEPSLPSALDATFAVPVTTVTGSISHRHPGIDESDTGTHDMSLPEPTLPTMITTSQSASDINSLTFIVEEEPLEESSLMFEPPLSSTVDVVINGTDGEVVIDRLSYSQVYGALESPAKKRRVAYSRRVKKTSRPSQPKEASTAWATPRRRQANLEDSISAVIEGVLGSSAQL